MSMSDKLVNLPKFVTLGAFDVEIILLPHEISYDVSEQQGSFKFNPPYKIFLDKDIVEKKSKDALNLVLHECLHVGYLQYSMKDKEEEHIVNSYGNFITELFLRSELKAWLSWQTT
jgi:hypothetical protein